MKLILEQIVEVNQMALDVMNSMFFTHIVKKPTRGSNILDLIFASSPDLVKNVKIRPGIGDHHSVTAEVQLRAKVSKKTTRTIFMYDKADETELKCEIAAMRQGFLTTCSLRTANENWQYFTTRLQQIVNTLVPKKIVRGRHDLPWLDPSLRRKIGKKNRFHRRAKKAKPYNRHQRWEAYRNLQHSVKEEIKVAYNHYINSPFEDEETGKPSKNFWKTIKAKRRDQVGIPPLQGKNG